MLAGFATSAAGMAPAPLSLVGLLAPGFTSLFFKRLSALRSLGTLALAVEEEDP